MVRRTDRPAMTIDVDLGRKATKQTKTKQTLCTHEALFDSRIGPDFPDCNTSCDLYCPLPKLLK